MEIAKTILAQLGGSRFIAMTGAKQFVGGNDFLQFDLPKRFAKNGIDKVRITLNSLDLYNVEFYKWNARKLDLSTISKAINIDVEELARVFTMETGLDTRF